jgi:predicted DNA-binding protein with PD1-like motif
MQSKLVRGPGGRAERTWVLVFDVGDTVVRRLEDFAREQALRGAHFSAVGAFSHVVLRYFQWDTKQYRDIPLDEQVEVLTLTGDIARKADGQPAIHAHLIVGRADGTTPGGHLKEARVRPTLELVLTEEPGHLVRRHDEETGLALIDVGATEGAGKE